MEIFKNEIKLSDREKLEEFIGGFPHETSGVSFSSIYMWSREYTYRYEIVDDFLCMAGLGNFKGEEEEPFLFPVLPRGGKCDKDRLAAVLENLIGRFRKGGKPFVMRLIPAKLREIYEAALPERFIFIDDRSNYGYLYRVSDLAELKGKAFHGKKNHLNRFNCEYGSSCEVVPMSSALTEEALDLVKRINDGKEVSRCERILLEGESLMLEKALPDFEKIGLEGVALRIGGKLQGFAFGGPLGKDTIVEHVEKANIAYNGIYQKLNNEFCRSLGDRYEFVNREEDMGLEGLRKSKNSYRPVRLIEKCIALLDGDEEAMERYGKPY